jgi:prepilin-type N-terminal cleavage/methylation domain-containing protein
MKRVSSQRQKLAGFTLLEVMVISAIVGIMAMIAVPNFIKARVTAQQKMCIKNLHSLSETKQQWGFENKRPATAIPTPAQLQVYYGKSRMPVCPSQGTYSLRALNREPVCNRAALGHTY